MERLVLEQLESLEQLQVLQLDRDVPGSSLTQGRALTRQERFDRLRSSLEALTPDQRKAVVLSRIDGLSTRDIAREMNRSEDAVRQLLTRALKQLKSSFGDTESLHLPDRSFREEGL